jgi:mediator of RNA polymerase II transcription subunit 31
MAGTASSSSDPTGSAISKINAITERFEIELEFVQALASPAYSHFLATTAPSSEEDSSGALTYLTSPNFLAFLKYLRYWKEPEYAVYISFPHCLHFLDLLIESEAFRRDIAKPAFRDYMHQEQYKAWKNHEK